MSKEIDYYKKCFFAGLFPCAITHTLLTPLDVFKCRKQIDPKAQGSLYQGLTNIYKTSGLRGMYVGYQPTIVGYALQGSTKYGLYEVFKANILTDHTTLRYLISSAMAEVIADCFLCPMESLKVRMQTGKNFTSNFVSGIREIMAKEGIHGFYKGLVPLIFRQVPNTMVKFATFENSTKFLYRKFCTKPKNEYSNFTKLIITFIGGYISGIFCCFISNPADTIMSKYNSMKTSKNTPLLSSVKTIYQEVGFFGLWRGLSTRILMTGTLSALEWLIYDSFKTMAGLPTTGET